VTRVLVVGGSGMLGHKLVQVLGGRFETWATVRGEAPAAGAAELLDPARTITGVRAEEPASIARALDACDPVAVVNAVGIVKQADAAKAAVPSIRVNALFPHELANACSERGARLIHISTDCVFAGRRGGYAEDDVPDATDLYGRSKLLGEVTDAADALTLRTSIVGRELEGAYGLIEWFLSQRGGRVRGFSRAVFSGFTTAALADLIGDAIEHHPQLHGLWHVSAAPIDKLTLLRQVRDAIGADIEIEPDDALAIDRSLDSSRFRAATGWTPPEWTTMIAGLAADPTPYEELRRLSSHR
jgi:dTDP-4-dehydrorhamnose reductase